MVRKRVAAHARARYPVRARLRIVADADAHGDAVDARVRQELVALVPPRLAQLVLRIEPLQRVDDRAHEALGLQRQPVPPQTLERRRVGGGGRVVRRVGQRALAVRFVDGRTRQQQRLLGAQVGDVPLPLVEIRRAAKLRRAERDHLAERVRVVLQVGHVEHELAPVVDRADAEHVPEGVRLVPPSKVEHEHLARALLPNVVRDLHDRARIRLRALRQPRVAADRLLRAEAAHLLPRLGDEDDGVISNERVGDDDGGVSSVEPLDDAVEHLLLQDCQGRRALLHRVDVSCFLPL
mmetsp:Transcript_70485/g.187427  ORF Transcript_70485/g.187427 Transcript_70485/m.187427 type:complete len:294 (+) Transcript_70485:438-1319(+)